MAPKKTGIMSGVRKSGPPPKEVQLQNKLKRAELKMEELKVQLKGELTDVNAQLVRDYKKYIAFLDDVAQGRVAEASVTARIGACDKLIKRVDELKEELEMNGVDPESLGESEIVEKEEGKVVSLINF